MYSMPFFSTPHTFFLMDLANCLCIFLHHSPDQETIVTPGFAKWGSLNDRLAFSQPSAMLAYCSRGGRWNTK